MEYLNCRRLIQGEHIVPMAQLIKIMLMGHDCGPLQQVQRLHYGIQDEQLGIIDDDYEKQGWEPDQRVFSVQGLFLGFIVSTGPSTRDIVAKMEAVSTWHKTLLQNFPDELGPATLESNTLLRTILDSTIETLDNCCLSLVSSVQWRPMIRKQAPRNVICNDIDSGWVQAMQNSLAIRRDSHTHQLIQLKPAYNFQLRRKMGIASPEARPGDLVYPIPGVKHCVTIRLTGGTMQWPMSNLRMQVFGTCRLLFDKDSPLEPQSVQWQNTRDRYGSIFIQSLEVKMDARTLFILLS